MQGDIIYVYFDNILFNIEWLEITYVLEEFVEKYIKLNFRDFLRKFYVMQRYIYK